MKHILTIAFLLLTATACTEPELGEAAATQAVDNCPQPQLSDDGITMSCPVPPGTPPTCHSLGCTTPSGSPTIWEPCYGTLCYCRPPGGGTRGLPCTP